MLSGSKGKFLRPASFGDTITGCEAETAAVATLEQTNQMARVFGLQSTVCGDKSWPFAAVL
jgi:hypothetical protein